MLCPNQNIYIRSIFPRHVGYLEKLDRKCKSQRQWTNKTVFCGLQGLRTYKLISIVIACINLSKNKSVRISESRAEMIYFLLAEEVLKIEGFWERGIRKFSRMQHLRGYSCFRIQHYFHTYVGIIEFIPCCKETNKNTQSCKSLVVEMISDELEKKQGMDLT